MHGIELLMRRRGYDINRRFAKYNCLILLHYRDDRRQYDAPTMPDHMPAPDFWLVGDGITITSLFYAKRRRARCLVYYS